MTNKWGIWYDIWFTGSTYISGGRTDYYNFIHVETEGYN